MLHSFPPWPTRCSRFALYHIQTLRTAGWSSSWSLELPRSPAGHTNGCSILPPYPPYLLLRDNGAVLLTARCYRTRPRREPRIDTSTCTLRHRLDPPADNGSSISYPLFRCGYRQGLSLVVGPAFGLTALARSSCSATLPHITQASVRIAFFCASGHTARRGLTVIFQACRVCLIGHGGSCYRLSTSLRFHSDSGF